MGSFLHTWTDHKDVGKIMTHAWTWFTTEALLLGVLGHPRMYILCQVTCGSKYSRTARGICLHFAFVRPLPLIEQVAAVECVENFMTAGLPL